jgi:two-component system LytT family response regulator
VRALIVDDEPLARRGVVLRLRKFKDVEIVGECADGQSAVQRILERSPDVVFLDIQMPGMDGFEVLRALPGESLPAIIFLTAYEQHVLRAFDVHALHYLLKPVDDTRFAAAVCRARDLVDSALKADMAQRVMKMLGRTSDGFASRFTVQAGSRIQIVIAEDVEWIGAAATVVLTCYARRWRLSNRGSTRQSLSAYTAPELCGPEAYWSSDPSRTASSR